MKGLVAPTEAKPDRAGVEESAPYPRSGSASAFGGDVGPEATVGSVDSVATITVR